MAGLPEHGQPLDEIMARLRSMQVNDADYHNARTWSLIYHGGPEVDAVLHEVASHVLLENALNPLVFPSLREMQREVVHMTAGMLHGGDDVGGTMTSGGTESNVLAVKTARDKARAERGIRHGKMIIPRTAHPSFIKAAEWFDVEWQHMPLGDDLRTRAGDLDGMIDDRTILCVGGAPAYPFGMIDPIPEMAAKAQAAGVPFHVDACLGGFMLPWVERLGYDVPLWDFRVPGVTSMSADIHKYGYAIKGASVLLHRPKSNLRHQVFMFGDWPGGLYGTQGFAGTKPAPPIAAAWAIMQFLGEDGYVRLARQTMDAAERLRAGVEATDGLHVWGEPDMSVMAVGSHDRSIFAIGDRLNERRWHFDRQEQPDSIHLMASARHQLVVDEFLEDLRWAVEHAPAHSATAATYGDDVSAEANARP